MPILRRSVVQFCSAPLVRFHTALDMRATWGQHANGRFNYLKQYIQFLRTDVERNPSVPEVIITERGGGYRLAVPPTFY